MLFGFFGKVFAVLLSPFVWVTQKCYGFLERQYPVLLDWALARRAAVLFTAFGKDVPSFAHVPLILGADKKRLSKRHGATSVMEYSRQGYLPEALFNFLALLGWSPGNDREIFDKGDLVEAFSLGGISGGNAVFNVEKLDWFNQQHIQRLPAAELAARIEPLLRERSGVDLGA
jgi:glutamyl/glutaminyl-tRNA synthetase